MFGKSNLYLFTLKSLKSVVFEFAISNLSQICIHIVFFSSMYIKELKKRESSITLWYKTWCFCVSHTCAFLRD